MNLALRFIADLLLSDNETYFIGKELFCQRSTDEQEKLLAFPGSKKRNFLFYRLEGGIKRKRLTPT